MSDSTQPIRVLLAEDDPTTRFLLARWLTRAIKAEVIEAENGLQALELLSTKAVELAVLDINMPVLDGIELLSLLRSNPAFKDIEVLIASTVQTESRVREAIALGVSDYLLKPLQYATVEARLVQAMERVLSKREQQSQQRVDTLPRVLIADPDPNFCEFAKSALTSHYCVESVRTSGDALVKMLRWQPDLTLLSPQLPGLSVAFLLGKIQSLCKARPMNICLLVDSDAEAAVPEGVAGTVAHTYVPETFCSRVAQLLPGGAPASRDVLSWVGALDPEVVTALRQAFGMMTGAECVEAAEAAEAPGFELFGGIDLEAQSGEFTLSLAIECRQDLAGALVSGMSQPQEAAGGQAAGSGVSEILNAIAGRIKNSCAERRIPVLIGSPRLSSSPPAPGPKLDHHWKRRFRWQQGQDAHEFGISFAAFVGRSAAPEPLPAAEPAPTPAPAP